LNGQFDDGTYTLSHEMLEWAADPFDHGARIQGQEAFLMNTAPAWSSPYYEGGAACTTQLEVADALEGFGALYVPGLPTNWLLADGAFLSWFARQSPSTAHAGLYDLGGIFNTYYRDTQLQTTSRRSGQQPVLVPARELCVIEIASARNASPVLPAARVVNI
jgi:hypothetical protein